MCSYQDEIQSLVICLQYYGYHALPSNRFISGPIIPGWGTSTAPAASRAFAFASALKSRSESKAPAWPIVFPGGAVRPATMAMTGFLPPLALYSLMTSAASSSASPPISPMTTIPSVESSEMKARRPSASVVPECCQMVNLNGVNGNTYQVAYRLPYH